MVEHGLCHPFFIEGYLILFEYMQLIIINSVNIVKYRENY